MHLRFITPEAGIERPANLAFGGADMKTFCIMGSTGVYRLPLLVAGERPMYTK